MSTRSKRKAASLDEVKEEEEAAAPAERKRITIDRAHTDVWIEVRHGAWSTHVNRFALLAQHSDFIDAAINYETNVLEFVENTFHSRDEFMHIVHVVMNPRISDFLFDNSAFCRWVYLFDNLGLVKVLRLILALPKIDFLTAEEALEIGVVHKQPRYIKHAVAQFKLQTESPSHEQLAAMWPYLCAL